jgi:hypothetical protein
MEYRAVGRQPVKSRRAFRRVRRRAAFVAGVLGFVLGSTFPSLLPQSFAQTEESLSRRPLLLGGAIAPEKSVVRLDPVLPRGALRAQEQEDLLLKNHVCSLKRPVCVSSLSGGAGAREAVALLERAFEEARFGLGLALEEFSSERPLVWSEPLYGSDLTAQVTRLSSRGFDRGRARCAGGAPTLETARRCVFEAVSAEDAPATAPWLRSGFGASVARALGEAAESSEGQMRSLAHPEVGALTNTRAVDDAHNRPAFSVPTHRSSRFFDYLGARSRKSSAEAGMYLFAFAPTRTPLGSARWEAEPDLLDVLRVTLGGDRVEMARFMDDFAVQSFLGAQTQGQSVAVDWEIPGETLPRGIAITGPMEPTGSVYVKVLLPPPLRSKVIGFRMNCEAPVSYVWSVVRLDEEGQELSRMPITFRERSGEASGRVLPKAKMTALLLVGTNLGGVDLAHPFDPDHGPHEAHGCTVAINVVPDDEASATKD